MRQAENLTNQVFGNLTVLFRDYENEMKKYAVRWRCKCSCGNETSIRASHLKSGKTKSCGCLVTKKENLSGLKFGFLTVLYRKQDDSRYCVCLCECGNITTVYASNLKRGLTKSCGCYHKKVVSEALTKDLTGQKFGILTVLKKNEFSTLKNSKNKTQWICLCECGNKKLVSAQCLTQGRTQSCGCLKSRLSSERFSHKLNGQHFGKLTVVHRDGTFVGEDGAQYSQWKCICDCGTIKTVRGHDLVRGSVMSCGCTISRGEETMRNILNNKNIKFDTQYGFKDLKSDKGWLLKFDFAILDDSDTLLALIEYQGIQHFIEQPQGFGKQQREITDPMKRKYCKKNNIKLFEISYKDNIEKSINNIISYLNISYVDTVPSLSLNQGRCNDYPAREYILGEIPNMEVPRPLVISEQ